MGFVFSKTSIAALLLATLTAPGYAQAPTDPHSKRLEIALDVLNRVPSGREMIVRAEETWKLHGLKELLGVLRWGAASKTDAVLTRRFDAETGREQRDRQVTIYLRSGQPLQDLILDIAHELVHATAKASWDPYDPKLTPGHYIWSAIEGDGGEVEAVIAECRVGLELSERFGTSIKRCQGYLASDHRTIGREQVRRDFYRVGKWSRTLQARLGGEIRLFPLLSSDAPRLYSSTGHTPYPMALYDEFEEITDVACQNSRKRILAFASREPASASNVSQGLLKSEEDFVSKRCKRK